MIRNLFKMLSQADVASALVSLALAALLTAAAFLAQALAGWFDDRNS